MEFYNIQDFYGIINNISDTTITIIKDIVLFWKNNKDMWFSHEEIAYFPTIQTIYNNNININFALLLHYDQIFRHPCKLIREKDKILAFRFASCIALRIIHDPLYTNMDTCEKIFTLLALRHNKSIRLKMFSLKKAFYELNNNPQEQNQWLRFINASILDIDKEKIQEGFTTKNNIVDDNFIENDTNYFAMLREKHESLFEKQSIVDINFNIEKQKNHLLNNVNSILFNKSFKKYDKFAVSISGGVDSMVLSYITNIICKENNKKLILLHICYNNRECCNDEIEFLIEWAKYLNVEIYIREINELQRERNSKYRTMYEEVTRKIRFSFYKYFDCPILLGHNRDDTFENIFSNLSKQIHFENLIGMNSISCEDNIYILRPFLSVDKVNLLLFADTMNIPHLIDSTPVWSRRGKTRDTLIPLINKFDSNILYGLEKFIKYTKFIQNQWEIHFEEWNKENIIIDNNNLTIYRNKYFENNKQNISFWIKIWFENSMKTRPSNKSFRNLISNIELSKNINCDMNKYYKCIIYKTQIKFIYKDI
jgi:tRNA(Ile)-lysidine synthetase-like protein